MDPAVAKRLLEHPETEKLVIFLKGKTLELNNLHDIQALSENQIAIEVLARQRAYQKLVEILDPFLTADIHTLDESTMKDYVV